VCLFLLCGSKVLVGVLFYICIVLAFLVRMPIFIFHSWLPKSHADVPVSGSVFLAGVLLKLGGYPLTQCICPIRGKLPLPSSSEVHLLQNVFC
jgi:NADH-ubiquinone oxidoreductase chain 4